MWLYNYSTSDELYHHGVLGMKCGKRKARGHTGTDKQISKKKSVGMTINKLKQQQTGNISLGNEFLTNQIMQQQVQQATNLGMQESTRASINASLVVSSLTMSGGSNQFMFGQT